MSTGQSPFHRAFQALLDEAQLQPKKHRSAFLEQCKKAGTKISVETAASLVAQAEERSSQKTSRRVVKAVIEPFVETMKAYDGVITSLCSADPMPTAIIWGALKVVIDGLDRFSGLFTTIRSQLDTLRYRTEDVQAYEALYGKSPELQHALFAFYKDLLRFWSRVDKECKRRMISHIGRALAPFSMTKIRQIIEDVETDVENIQTKAHLIELRESKEDRSSNSQSRQDQQVVNRVLLYSQICDWLSPSTLSNSLDVHRTNRVNTTAGTLQWLCKIREIESWTIKDPLYHTLWVTASPGVGKTVACSTVIEHVLKSPDTTACYYFFRHVEDFSAREILRCFALQLLEHLWHETPSLTLDFQQAIQHNKEDSANIVAVIRLMVPYTTATFFFLDGLDECVASSDAKWVVTTLSELCITFAGKARFWCSSQDIPGIASLMTTAQKVCLDGRMQDDISICLSRALDDTFVSDGPQMVGESQEKAKLLSSLCKRAKGNFLWAYLMKHEIEQADSMADMQDIVETGLPDQWAGPDGYYARLLRRIKKADWPTASLLLSLICYARRPLRVQEVQDAVAILRSDNKLQINSQRRPRLSRLQEILTPLVHCVEGGAHGPVYETCHTTFKLFIEQNPDVIPGHTISSMQLGDACLWYLSQHKFSRLFHQESGSWLSQEGTPLERDFLVTYAAKYWDKHLDGSHFDQDSPMSQRVAEFVKSSNFWTCLQVQSLCVEGKFQSYRIVGAKKEALYRPRSLPHWFAYQRDIFQTIGNDYRKLVHEWDYFLDGRVVGRAHHGELDRCFLSAFGPQHFLSNAEQRYESFCLGLSDQLLPVHQYEVCTDGSSEVNLVEIQSTNNSGRLAVRIQRLSPTPGTEQQPLLSDQFKTHIDATNWRLHSCPKHELDRICTCFAKSQAVTTTPDGSILKIANRLWVWKPGKGFEALEYPKRKAPPYQAEHVERKGEYVVITSRQKVSVKQGFKYGSTSNCGTTTVAQAEKEDVQIVKTFYDTWTSQNTKVHDDMHSKDDAQSANAGTNSVPADPIQQDQDEPGAEAEGTDTSELSSSPSENSDTDESMSAEEFWSEGSTDSEEDDTFKDRAPLYYASSRDDSDEVASVSSDSDDEATSDSDMSYTVNLNVGAMDDETGRYSYVIDQSDEENHKRRRGSVSSEDSFGIRSDDENYIGGWKPLDGLEDERVDQAVRSMNKRWDLGHYLSQQKKQKKRPSSFLRKPMAMLNVYRQAGTLLEKVFTFYRSGAQVIHNSPPAIHPTKPLVVWPVSEELLLFADYKENTWFTRKLRVTSNASRHLTVRCHFSASGEHLHIAALEHAKPQSKPSKGKESKQKAQQGKHSFALILFTYRLSRRKTTRSPPLLVHRVKTLLPAMLYPLMTFTWTDEHLYATHSNIILTVYRVCLFTPNGTVRNSADGSHDESLISVLRERIYLPRSATLRPVYFFPASAAASKSQQQQQVHNGKATAKSRQLSLSSQSPAQQGSKPSSNMATVYIGAEKPPCLAQSDTISAKEVLHRTGVQVGSRTEGTDGNPDDDNADDEADNEWEGEAARAGRKLYGRRAIGIDGPAPMIGVFLDEDKDLGGWRASTDVEKISNDAGVGQLDRMVELFDAVTDCDVEPYIFE